MKLTKKSEEICSEMIKLDEGFKAKPYLDTENNWTVGWGHYLLNYDPLKKYVFKELEDIFENDFNKAMSDAYSLCEAYRIINLSQNRLIVLINMAFNLGRYRLRLFEKMWIAITKEDYKEAKIQMLNSPWHKIQCPDRSLRLAEIMETDKI